MPKLLVVDDELKLREKTARNFSLAKWSVDTVATGAACLEKIDPSFDAVILDLRLPDIHGEKVLERIRARPELDAVCVIVLTAYGEVDSAVRSLRIGAYQYVQKPFSTKHLVPLLMSGMAWQKAHALTHSLLASPNFDATLEGIRVLLSDTLNAGHVYVALFDSHGRVERVVGGPVGDDHRPQDRRFVRQVLDEKKPLFESHTDVATTLQSVMPDTRSLIAAPVTGAGGTVVGVLDIESSVPDAFDRNWIAVVSYLSDLVAIARELSAKQQLLVEREQWRELPIIVGELRHQISSPAQAIDMQAELAVKMMKDDSLSSSPSDLLGALRKRMGVIRRQASTIRKVCAYLGDISNEIPIEKSDLKIVPLVRACLDEVRGELTEKHVQPAFVCADPKGLSLRADRRLVRYCLECLLRNAVEAIEERRQQDLRTDFDDAEAGDQLEVRIDHANLERLTISVVDTGLGIRASDRERVFQPLFSTKRRREPGGMGLFSVKRIMNKHEGHIDFVSEPGKGATFSLHFPRR